MPDLSNTRTPRNASQSRREEQAQATEKRKRASRENRGFVQVYPLGWRRLQLLMASNPKAARLYALLAEHLDTMGAVIATQEVLAEMLGVSVKTIQRYSQQLEDARALVRIPIQGGVYAYALSPEEVWKAYDSGKEYAAFYTRTLVNARGAGADIIKRRLQVMLQERRQQTSEDATFSPENEGDLSDGVAAILGGETTEGD